MNVGLPVYLCSLTPSVGAEPKKPRSGSQTSYELLCFVSLPLDSLTYSSQSTDPGFKVWGGGGDALVAGT